MGSASPTSHNTMLTAVAPTTRAALAEEFVLDALKSSSSAMSLAELVRAGTANSEVLSPEETRSAIATLVDQQRIALTDDLRVRMRTPNS